MGPLLVPLNFGCKRVRRAALTSHYLQWGSSHRQIGTIRLLVYIGKVTTFHSSDRASF